MRALHATLVALEVAPHCSSDYPLNLPSILSLSSFPPNFLGRKLELEEQSLKLEE
jgi:hypothetical protein